MPRFLFVLFLLTTSARAQFSYTIDQSIPVTGADDTPLSLAWSGGLNSAQISTMHLDDDDKEDLVIFDRSGGKLMTYLNKTDHYEYSPDYEAYFPSGLGQWVLLRDFNCDGRKDIFTSNPFGISVFVNTTPAGSATPTWREFNPGSPLLTKGFSGNINLKVNETDIPAIDDIDGDGDLDILNLRFVGAGTIEYHKNFSMERSGNCDSLQLERVTQDYGSVEECSCGRFAFGNQTCDLVGGGRTDHVGGKALLAIDLDNDGDRDLLFSEESCGMLYMLRNTGSTEVPFFQSAVNFPPNDPAVFRFFPAPFHEDVDFDGIKDLLVSPNLFARVSVNSVVKESVWFYKNAGTNQNPVFSFVKRNFLQDQMIDVGDYSTPAFFDADGDGDDDLFIGKYAGDDSFIATIVFYENTGSPSAPVFKLRSEDVAGLTGLIHYNFKPFFADMNADGRPDLAWTSTSLTNGITALQYIANNRSDGLGLSGDGYVVTAFRVGQPENVYATDVNQDGRIDLLVGRSTGALQYYENQGTSNMFDQMVLVNESFLGLGSSTSRQNPVVATGDLDGDGLQDLVMANQRGQLTIYADYRNFDPMDRQPHTEIIYNTIGQTASGKSLGARVWPTIVNLFGSNRPAIVVGNTMGGVNILKNTEGVELPDKPVIVVFPNPVDRGGTLSIKSDRNVVMQVFSILGQKMSEPIFVPGGQIYPLAINNVAAGIYIARFTYGNQSVSVKFVLR